MIIIHSRDDRNFLMRNYVDTSLLSSRQSARNMIRLLYVEKVQFGIKRFANKKVSLSLGRDKLCK